MKHREYLPRRGGHITKIEKEIMKTILEAEKKTILEAGNKKRNPVDLGVRYTSDLVDVATSNGTQKMWNITVVYSNGVMDSWILPSITGLIFWE